ncbi:uncharacterized protein HaLaN_12288 [Haematococcus lacustris]|uniref:AMP-activated protein kinase glycogen-binding domain-containing protein n=1 Tax=Haematococcus lacustris TaxID=44745 RepID=A0A699Z308_HAELA|nr:uncharacterized protein HaLaN_12288 [Haematococcus lacustris]
MNRKMGTSLSYRHELGIDYNRILPDLIEDCDMAYFKLDLEPIKARCMERGDVKHVRFPIRDFDPYDLRRKLPKAVARLAREHDPKAGTVYIHCTAGTDPVETTIAVHRFGQAKSIQVAGLDVGWHAPLPMEKETKPPFRFVLHRKLYPGKYQYKLIVDGNWTFSADHPTARDNNNTNNVLEVIPAKMDPMTVQTQLSTKQG